MFDRMRPFAALIVSLVSLTVPAFGQLRPTINLNCSRGESLAAVVGIAFP